MKKILINAAWLVAVSLLASCADDEIIDGVESNSGEISYEVVTNGATRAIDNYCNDNMPTSFSVYSYQVNTGATPYTYQQYFANDKITKSGDKWVGESVRYWPNTSSTNKLWFYAFVNATRDGSGNALATSYTPTAVNNTDNSFGGMKITDYNTVKNSADNRDLLYAITGAEKPSSTTSKVALNFRHALAQVQFKIKNANKALTVYVNSISFVNVVVKDDVTFGFTATSSNLSDHSTPATSTTANYSTQCTWYNTTLDAGTAWYSPDAENTSAKYLYLMDTDSDPHVRNERLSELRVEEEDEDCEHEDGYVCYEYPYTTTTTVASDGTSTETVTSAPFPKRSSTATTNDHTTDVMYIIPQTINNAWDPSITYSYNEQSQGYYLRDFATVSMLSIKNHGCAYMCICCNVYNNSRPDDATNNQKELVYRGNIYLPFANGTTFEAGKKYVYTFVFGTGNGGYNDSLNPVLVPISIETITFDSYVDVGNTDVDMDKSNNTDNGGDTN